jgi:hypothetical protein
MFGKCRPNSPDSAVLPFTRRLRGLWRFTAYPLDIMNFVNFTRLIRARRRRQG